VDLAQGLIQLQVRLTPLIKELILELHTMVHLYMLQQRVPSLALDLIKVPMILHQMQLLLMRGMGVVPMPMLLHQSKMVPKWIRVKSLVKWTTLEEQPVHMYIIKAMMMIGISSIRQIGSKMVF